MIKIKCYCAYFHVYVLWSCIYLCILKNILSSTIHCCWKLDLGFFIFHQNHSASNYYKNCPNCFTFYFTNRCYYSSNQQGVKLKVATVTLFFRLFFHEIEKAFYLFFYFIFMSTKNIAM